MGLVTASALTGGMGGVVVYKLRGSIPEHMHCKLRLRLVSVSVGPRGCVQPQQK